MKSSTSLRQLEYFVAAAEASNFRRAALRLRVSQPTVTNQIATLERALSVRLFERTSTGSLLTPAGRELLAGARRVIEEHQALVDQAASISKGPMGTYRLGVTPTLGPYLLPHVLPELHNKFAALKFYVREGVPRVLEEDLIAGEHDLILTALPVQAGDLTVVPLFREPLVLVVPAEHRLAKKPQVAPSDLEGAPVLTLEEHHLFHHQIDRLCERLGARALRDYEGTSLDTLRQMVVMGMGVAFLPALYVKSEVRQPTTLHVTRVEGEAMFRTHALVWRATSPSAEVFRKVSNEIHRLVAESLDEDVELLSD